METKGLKGAISNFKYGDDVFVYIEYEGIVEGIIRSINDNVKPFLYVVEGKDKEYQVSQLHTFGSYKDANAYINSCVRDGVIDLCDKLGIDMPSCRVRMNAFLRNARYTKQYVWRFIGQNVNITLDNGQKLNGLFQYCKYYKAKDGVVSENFYYVKCANTNMFTAFKLADIEKIENKEKTK